MKRIITILTLGRRAVKTEMGGCKKAKDCYGKSTTGANPSGQSGGEKRVVRVGHIHSLVVAKGGKYGGWEGILGGGGLCVSTEFEGGEGGEEISRRR